MKFKCRIGWHDWDKWGKPEKKNCTYSQYGRKIENSEHIRYYITRVCKECGKSQMREI